jgi:hypothetical protein
LARGSLSANRVAFDHDALVQLFRNRPELCRDLARAVIPRVARRDAPVQVDSADLGHAEPLARAADFVARVGRGKRAVRIIVEVQLSPDADKRRSWPGYVGVSWAKSGVRSYLVVVAPDPAIAAWARRPIDVGHYQFRPLVVGPEALPLSLDEQRATRFLELAVLGLRANIRRPELVDAATLLARVLRDQSSSEARFYLDLVYHWLEQLAPDKLEAVMLKEYGYQSSFAKRYFREGRAEGLQEGRAEGLQEGRAEGLHDAILRVLAARGIAADEALAARIRACTEIAMLERWLERALGAASASAVVD